MFFGGVIFFYNSYYFFFVLERWFRSLSIGVLVYRLNEVWVLIVFM